MGGHGMNLLLFCDLALTCSIALRAEVLLAGMHDMVHNIHACGLSREIYHIWVPGGIVVPDLTLVLEGVYLEHLFAPNATGNCRPATNVVVLEDSKNLQSVVQFSLIRCLESEFRSQTGRCTDTDGFYSEHVVYLAHIESMTRNSWLCFERSMALGRAKRLPFPPAPYVLN